MQRKRVLLRAVAWCMLFSLGAFIAESSTWALEAERSTRSDRDRSDSLDWGEIGVAFRPLLGGPPPGYDIQGVERARAVLGRLRERVRMMEHLRGSTPGSALNQDPNAPPFPHVVPTVQEMNRAYEEFRAICLEARERSSNVTQSDLDRIAAARERLFAALDTYLDLLDQRTEYMAYYNLPAKAQELNSLSVLAAVRKADAFRAEAVRAEAALFTLAEKAAIEDRDAFAIFDKRAVPRETVVKRSHRMTRKRYAPTYSAADLPAKPEAEEAFNLAVLSPPTVDDTTPNVDVRITDEMRAIATALGNDPVRIFNFVRNTIEFVPYYGSLKGSELTLLDRAGNDMDTCSLLIALFRAAGIPARYVVGAVSMDYDRYRNLAGVETKEAVVTVVGTLARPGSYLLLDSQGNPEEVRVGHAWVAAFLPTNYRGTGGGEGSAWIQMDPTIKNVQRTPEPSLSEFTDLDPEVVGQNLMAAGVYDASTSQMTSYDPTVTENLARDLAGDVDAFYQDRGVAGDFFGENEALYGGASVDAREYGVIPASLPFEVNSVDGIYPELPASLRYSVQFNFIRKPILDPFDPRYDPFGEQVARTYGAPELAAKRVTITFIPQSGADAEAMYTMNQPTPVITLPDGATAEVSRLQLINPNVVEMLPMLRIDGVPQMLGPIQGMCEDHELEITITGPQGSYNETGSFEMQAGGYTAVGFDFGGTQAELSNRLVEGLIDRLEDFEATVAQQESGTPITEEQEIPYDDLIGAALHIAAINYFTELNFKQQQWAQSIGVFRVRNPSVGLISQEMSVIESIDIIGRVSRQIIGSNMSLEVDVDLAVQTMISKNRKHRDLVADPLEGGTPLQPGEVMNDSGTTREEFLAAFASGVSSSQTEHRVMERQLGNESFSAMKMLADSVGRGEPMTVLSKALLATEAGRELTNSEVASAIRAKLSDYFAVYPDTQSGIINAVNRGQVVFAPGSGVVVSATDDPSFRHYSGTGYIHLDPANAAGGYIISTNLAGSATLCGSETSDVAELVTCVKSQLGSIAPACCCTNLPSLGSGSSIQDAAIIDACAGCAANIATAFIDISGLIGEAITCLVARIAGPALDNLAGLMDDILQTYPNEGRDVQPSAELKRMADTISMTLIVLFGLFSNATGQLLDTLGIALPIMPGGPAIIGAYMALMLAHFFTLDLLIENPAF